MADESEAASRARYRAQMEDEKKAGQEKNKDTELSGRAVGMVDAAGGWMDCQFPYASGASHLVVHVACS